MSYTLQIDIPFETTSKRAIKVEEAEHLVEVARMDAAEIAWNIRHQIQLDLIGYQELQRNLKLLERELDSYNQLIHMLQKRVALGMGSNTELSQYQLMQQKSQIQLRNANAKTEILVAKLAADVGLSLAEFKRIPIAVASESVAIDQHTLYHQKPCNLRLSLIVWIYVEHLHAMLRQSPSLNWKWLSKSPTFHFLLVTLMNSVTVYGH